jgi:protocatechuate 3,4-dioxygenase alpha subunit
VEPQTPSQTVGPFFGIGLIVEGQNILVDDLTHGERVHIGGTVFDGHGAPIPDAMVEIWQADAGGYFNHPSDPERENADPYFQYFGRAGTDEDGRYWFSTVRPGLRGGKEAQLAPYINVRIFARGMLIHALTRIYFSDESANSSDPVLGTIDPARRGTLIAQRLQSEGGTAFRFDIHLQGGQETVFFDP